MSGWANLGLTTVKKMIKTIPTATPMPVSNLRRGRCVESLESTAMPPSYTAERPESRGLRLRPGSGPDARGQRWNLPLAQHQAQHDAADEAAGVRPPGNPAHLSSLARQLNGADEQLENKPQAQVNHRGDLHKPGNDEDRDKREHSAACIQDEVRPQDPGDRSGRADCRNHGFRVRKRLRAKRGRSAEEIEKDKTSVTQPVLDVVAKNPEVEHVADDVGPAAVEKHRGEDRQEAKRAYRVPAVVNPVDETGRDEAKQLQHLGRTGAKAHFLEKDDDVDNDQPHRNERGGAGPDRVSDGDHLETS